MVEGTGLENRRTGNGTVSSNLTLSVPCRTRNASVSAPARWRMKRRKSIVDGRKSTECPVEPRLSSMVYRLSSIVYRLSSIVYRL